EDIARTGGVPAYGVVGERGDHGDGDRDAEMGDGFSSRGDDGGTAHVDLHLLHEGGRLDGETTGVERDALPNQREMGLRPLGPVGGVDEAGGTGWAGGDAHGRTGHLFRYSGLLR